MKSCSESNLIKKPVGCKAIEPRLPKYESPLKDPSEE
jgi:hypothetical protein